MLTKQNKNTQKRANFYAIFYLTFARFLRIEEFIWACRELNADF